jgi:hypothetical protein
MRDDRELFLAYLSGQDETSPEYKRARALFELNCDIRSLLVRLVAVAETPTDTKKK